MNLDCHSRVSFIRNFSSNINRIFKGLVNSVIDYLCQTSFLLLVLLYDWFLKVETFFVNFYWSIHDLLRVPNSSDCAAYRSYIIQQGRTFKKRPDHLIIILGPERPSHNDLAKLILWCEPVGIRCISFYDHKNGIDRELLFEKVRRYNKHIIHKIKWGRSFDENIKRASKKEINGFQWKAVLRVNILGTDASNQELLEVSKKLFSEGCNSVDQATICQAMDQQLGVQSPDLAIVCGSTMSYFACTPWHLRLTQFIHIPSHHSLKLSMFLNCLHQYSHWEQRCGK